MRILFFTLSLVIVLVSCGEEKVETACLDAGVSDFAENLACNSGASVKEYTFQSMTVYVFDPGPCIAPPTQEVTDAACVSIGTLGGLAGNTEINGEDFFANAVFVRTVWEN